MLNRKMTLPVHLCFTLEFLLPTNYPRESATSFCSPHLPTWVGSTHDLWVCGFKKDTSTHKPCDSALTYRCSSLSSVDYLPGEGTYDLKITDANYGTDNGEFICKVRRVGSGTDLHTEKVSLTVLLPPEPPLISAVDEPMEEGTPAELECSSVGGSPPPEIRWYRRGSSSPLPAELTAAEDRSQATVSKLTLQPHRKDDQEWIECVVWNRAMAEGERMTTETKLDVNCEYSAGTHRRFTLDCYMAQG